LALRNDERKKCLSSNRIEEALLSRISILPLFDFFALQTVRCSAARASNFTKLSSMRLVRAAHAM